MRNDSKTSLEADRKGYITIRFSLNSPLFQWPIMSQKIFVCPPELLSRKTILFLSLAAIPIVTVPESLATPTYPLEAKGIGKVTIL